MAIDFPTSPSVGQQYTYGGITYTYTAQGVWQPGTASTAFVADSLAFNCGRLTYVSATQLKFAPFNGNRIKIGGLVYQIPSAGIAGLSNAGLPGATLLYVYAYLNAGVVTGEFSTTGHATSLTTGTEIKNGDESRTLIGMVYTTNVTPGQFSDSATTRWVRSWFNRGQQAAFDTTSGSTSSGSYVQASGLCYVMAWLGEILTAGFTGYTSVNAVASATNALLLDGVTTLAMLNYAAVGTASSGASIQIAVVAATEGFHHCGTMLASNGSSTSTITGNVYLIVG